MPIFQTMQFQIRPEALEHLLGVIKTFVAYVRDNEPGTLFYTSVQDTMDPTKFVHFMLFEDAATMKKHLTSPGVKAFVPILYAEAVNGVLSTPYDIVAIAK